MFSIILSFESTQKFKSFRCKAHKMARKKGFELLGVCARGKKQKAKRQKGKKEKKTIGSQRQVVQGLCGPSSRIMRVAISKGALKVILTRCTGLCSGRVVRAPPFAHSSCIARNYSQFCVNERDSMARERENGEQSNNVRGRFFLWLCCSVHPYSLYTFNIMLALREGEMIASEK